MPLWQPHWGEALRRLSTRQMVILVGIALLVLVVGIWILSQL
jgi:hypothetical protein